MMTTGSPRSHAPTAPAPRTTLFRFEPTPKGLAMTLLAGALTWIALKLGPVIFVIIVALFLVGTLTPAVEWLERKHWKRGLAIGVVFAVMVIVGALLTALTLPALVEQVTTLAKEEPALRARLADALSKFQPTEKLAESIRNVHYDVLAKAWAGTALEYSSRFAEIVAYLVSAVFLALYIMIDRDRLRGGLFALTPRTHHMRLSRVLLNLETIVGGYIRGQALTSAFMTAFTFALLTICGVRNSLAVAVFAGLADVLPYIGVFLSVGPAVAAAAAKGPVIVGVVLASMLAYEEFESRFLVPRIYGSALRLPSSIVLLSLLAGGTLMGIGGALLALPAAAVIRMLFEELRIELPGEDVDDGVQRARDDEAEEEYERRAEGVPAEKAAAIAVEMAEHRREEDEEDKDDHKEDEP